MANVNAPISVKSDHWFTISGEGWRRLNAGRPMGFLVREGISNIMDLDDVTEATVTLEEGHVSIEDNGEKGFSDANLISTIFLTDKQDSPTKRGRKGRGLKELIAAANKAVVETLGMTVEFKEEDGKLIRIETPNERKQGTKVEIWTDLETWKGEHVTTASNYLTRIIPPSKIQIKINNKINEIPKLISTMEKVHLETTAVIDGIQKSTYAYSNVMLYECPEGQKPWIYEMGVPIQEIAAPYHVDVQQRVPMNDNRDVVDQWYLKMLYAKIADHQADILTESEIQKEWITNAIGNCSSETQKKLVEKIVPKKSVYKTDNKAANDVAKMSGYELVDTSKMAYAVGLAVKTNILSSDSIAKQIDTEKVEITIPGNEWTPEMVHFARIAKWIGDRVINDDITVEFIRRDPDFTGFVRIADYRKETKTLRYNTHPESLSTGLNFEKPLSAFNLGILIHELSHRFGEDHDKEYIESLHTTGGQVAWILLTQKDDIPDLENTKLKAGKTIFITCCEEGCGKKREISTQDIHQVKRCKACQKKYRNEMKKKASRKIEI